VATMSRQVKLVHSQRKDQNQKNTLQQVRNP
jgi:hypothetical protein